MLFETKYKVNVPFCKVCNRNVKFSYSLEFFHSCLMNSSFLFFFSLTLFSLVILLIGHYVIEARICNDVPWLPANVEGHSMGWVRN